MKLYGGRLSPFFERVVLAVKVKGIADKVDLAGVPGDGTRSPEYLAINPIGRIPALDVDGRVLPESQCIIEYLDEAHPTSPALLPDAPWQAAQTRLLCRLADLYVAPVLVKFFGFAGERTFSGAPVDEAKADLAAALDNLEHYIEPGTHAVGDDWTAADCALIPMVFYLTRLGAMFGFDPFDGRPKLTGWHKAAMATDLGAESDAAMQTALNEYMAQQSAA